MKTMQSNSAQKANMRSTRKSNKMTTTPTNEKPKYEKESTSGKKLVQARLPFKILAGTPPSKPGEESVALSGDKVEISSNKRKLSYTDELENQKKIGKSNSKENLSTLEKRDTVQSIDVIVLDDEESEEEQELPPAVSSPKTPLAAVMTSQSKKKKNTPRSSSAGGSATMPKLQIKLPLIGKKKRKSKSASRSVNKTHASDSSDVELLSDEQHENPQKKLKLEEISKPKTDDVAQKQQPTLSEHVEADCQPNFAETKIQNKKLKTSPKSSSILEVETPSKDKKNKETQRTNQPEHETPKTSKTTRLSSKGNTTLEVEPNENSPKSLTKQSKRLSRPNSPQKLESSSKKNDDKKEGDPKISEDEQQLGESSSEKKIVATEISNKNTSAEQQSSSPSPKKEEKSSRRSKRISEKTEAGADDSSEPEIVSEKTNAADTSLNTELRTKLLTPKQRKLMEQRKKAREEKELKLQQLKEERERKLQEQREERERKLQEEKAQKQKEREERELQRKKEREEKEDQKRREREEKEDQRRKEKEDKERKRLAEIEAKNEEKRKKDEAKEEERRKKDDERRRKEFEKEEEENKKKKAAQAFTKFFVPKAAKPLTDEDQESRDDVESVDSLAFRPFQIKGDMKLAPFVRRDFKERSREKLDSFLKSTQTDVSALYIGELKSGAHTPLKGLRTVLKNNDDEDDVIILSSELENAAQAIDEPRTIPVETYKAKYYFFRENQRPPFYGTWRKKSTVITPRRPFALDKTFFDYEVDSDDEWEEEEPGESLNGSEDEKDESEDEDYEVDNEWFVPHGHLSDEELQNEDELGPDTSREAQKAKLKALQQEFAQEMKKKTEKIKPRLIGTIWEDENGNRPKLCPSIIWDSLCTRAVLFCEPPLVEEPEAPETEPSTPPPEKQKRIEINEELMKDLVRLVHGNRHSRVFLIKEFMEHVCNTCETIKNGECLAPTKSQIREKIDEIAEWSVVDIVNKKQKNKKKLCWVVAADVFDKYALGKLGLRNEWSYKLQPKFDKDKNDQNSVKETGEKDTKTESSEDLKSANIEKKKPKPPGITKFTKVLTKEEKQNQLTAPECIASPKATPKLSKEKVLDSLKIEQIKKSVTPALKNSSPSTTTSNKIPVVKKRVALLMSVPPGQEFSTHSKNALISQFLEKNKKTSTSKLIPSTDSEKSSNVLVSSVAPMDVDDVILLD